MMRTIDLGKDSALLITDRLIRNYFTGIDIAEGYLVLSNHPAYFTDARYFSAAKDKIEPLGISAILFENLGSIKKYLAKEKVATLYLDYERTTLADYESYKDFGLEIKDGNCFIRDSRAIKSEEEFSNIKKACEIIEKAYHKAIKKVKKGITERELCSLIEKYMIELGAEGPSFDTIVGFGAHGAVPHHETSDTKLEKGMAILVDTGCKYHGYCSDMTRMAFYGTPDKEFLDAYDAVLTANVKALDGAKAGMKSNEVDKIARDYLESKGYGKYFTHSLGHGVGLEIHEYPWLSSKRKNILENGMVFTDEPGVYFDGKWGIRIEDTVAMINGKAERLFTDSKELIIIKK